MIFSQENIGRRILLNCFSFYGSKKKIFKGLKYIVWQMDNNSYTSCRIIKFDLQFFNQPGTIMNTSRNKVRQSGFTLIELIIVIVIIGILAAIAVPKYTSLVADAKQAKLDGIGGAIASASATNYVLQASGKGGSAVANCAAAGALVSPAVSTGLAPDGTPTGGAGDAITCTLTVDGVSSAAFSVILTTTYAGS